MAASDISEITRNTERIHADAVNSLFGMFEEICEGGIAVDDRSRIVWINERYRSLLGIAEDPEAIGEPVESLNPNSLAREIVRTGKPILPDLMEIGGR